MTLAEGFAGGAILGAAAAFLLLTTSEILGCSGIVNSIILTPLATLRNSKQYWKYALMASFVPLATFVLVPRFDRLQATVNEKPSVAYAIAGLLVGFGAKLSNGCTSGHGICGLGRLSLRSLSAVMVFMMTAIATAMATKNWTRNVNNDTTFPDLAKYSDPLGWAVSGLVLFLAILAPIVHYVQGSFGNCSGKVLPAFVTGGLFCYGLYLCGMVDPARIMDFLDLTGFANGSWDPTLMAVMIAGVTVSAISYQLVDGWHQLPQARRHSLKKPLSLKEDASFSIPTNYFKIDVTLLSGAAVFGVGWAMTGLCPAPAIFAAAAGSPQVLLLWWPCYLIGAMIALQVINMINRRQEQELQRAYDATETLEKSEAFTAAKAGSSDTNSSEEDQNKKNVQSSMRADAAALQKELGGMDSDDDDDVESPAPPAESIQESTV